MSNPSERDTHFWQLRYLAGDLPWDSGVPDKQIFDRLDALNLPPGIGLDVGCGTGTHALELARRGWTVHALDIAPAAIEQARLKADRAALIVHWQVCDLAVQSPLPGPIVDFAFDRGCLHSVNEAQRSAFVTHLAACLKPGAWWLSLCGNRDDDRREDELGPPQLRAAALLGLVEPLFEIHRLERSELGDTQKRSHLAWAGLFRRRSL